MLVTEMSPAWSKFTRATRYLIYMLEGTATLVTGGTVIDAKTIEPEEIRGRKSEGGESRLVAKGDVIVIPNRTPHWFKEMDGAIQLLRRERYVQRTEVTIWKQ